MFARKKIIILSIILFGIFSGAAFLIQREVDPTIQKGRAAGDSSVLQTAARESGHFADKDSHPSGGSRDENHFSEKNQALLTIGRRNLKEAIDFVNAQYPAEHRQSALSFMMRELGKGDLGMVNSILPLITSKQDLAIGLGVLIEFWVKKDALAVEEFVETQTNQVTKNQMAAILVQTLSQTSKFENASRMLSKMPFSDERSNAISSFAAGYASKRPIDAVQWALQLPLKEDVSLAQQVVLSTLVANKSADGLREFVSAAPSKLRSEALIQLGNILATGDASLILEGSSWTQMDRELLVTGAINSADGETLHILADYLPNFQNPSLKSQAVTNYVGRLFAVNQSQAIKWATQSAPLLRDDAVRGLVNSWYRTDSFALSDWINALPKGNDRDTALVSLASLLNRSDKKAAAEVAGAIGDAKLRDRILENMR